MKEEFSELVQYLDRKFGDIDNKLRTADQRSIDLDDKLRNLQSNKADKSDINNLLSIVNDYVQKADSYFREIMSLISKINRQ